MIPKILHFCYGLTPDFGGQPFGLVHYACIRSAVERIKPDQAFLYCEFEPKGPWWDLTKDIVQVVKIEAPREVFGNPLLHPAHRADVVRLQKLLECGGIYLDCDVFVHRSFDDLLAHSAVLGDNREGNKFRLCNAVILSEPGAPFLRRWYEQFRMFRSKGRDDYYDELACTFPTRLATEFPDEVTILPLTAFFWPSWQKKDLPLMFVSREPLVSPDAYANHLWQGGTWDPFLEDLTPGKVRKVDSAFHYWVRPMVSHLPADFGQPPLMRRLAREARRFARRLRSAASHPRLTLRKKLVGPVVDKVVEWMPDSALARRRRRRAFQLVYRNKKWGSGEEAKFFSGVGSHGAAADTYVAAMAPILAAHAREAGSTTTIVDLGCGDFAIGGRLLSSLPNVRYIGCDIVPEMVAHNNRCFGNDSVRFETLDIISQPLPDGDICLARQVLQHLPNGDISVLLPKLRKYRHVYVTEAQPVEPEGPPNPDIPVGAGIRFDWQTGRGRGVELNLPPWNLAVEVVCRAPASLSGKENEIITTYRIDNQRSPNGQKVQT
jgi:hypothetical protein